MLRTQLPRLRRIAPVFLLVSFLAGVSGPAASAAPPGEPDAILAVVSGSVTVVRGAERIAGTFGAALRAGDIVETGGSAQAGVIFSSGQIIELGPGSRITIGSIPARAKPGKPAAGGDLLAEVPGDFAGQLNRFAQTSGEAGLSALPALRGGGEEARIQPLFPRRTLVPSGTLAFQWSALPDAIEYRVMLAGPGPAKGTHRAETASWALPENLALEAGEQWTWSVEAVTADGAVRSETCAFEVAPDSVTAAARTLSERLDPLLASGDANRADAARYLLGSYCRSLGLYGEAIPHLESLVARHPERAELHRELGYLYQAIGRNDRAAEEYRSALKP
jgi:hypothetical protein